jgi:hypothetical protein
MPNNTFIKLFKNFGGADGDDAGEKSKQDELQSIQYVDQNYVESSLDTENESVLHPQDSNKNFNMRIVYNPAKNKSKSLARVGPVELANFQALDPTDPENSLNLPANSNTNSSNIKMR